MKKHLLGILSVLTLLAGGFSMASYITYFPQALQWMYSNGLTMYNTSDGFRPTAGIIREEGSKFFAEFAKKIMNKTVGYNSNCNFSDMWQVDPTLANSVTESCQLGIFYGDKGKFYPKRYLTNAQAITVLMRVLEGKKDETTNPWYLNYYNKAFELGLLNDLDIGNFDSASQPATRGDIAVMIWRASSKQPFNSSCANSPWGSLQNGQTVVAYQYSTPPAGYTCDQTKQIRTCSNGMLDGSYQYTSCGQGGNGSCSTSQWGTLQNGQTVKAYMYQFVPVGTDCESNTQVRTCSNGQLNGSTLYQYSSCTQTNNNIQHDFSLTNIILDPSAGNPTVGQTYLKFTFYVTNIGGNYNYPVNCPNPYSVGCGLYMNTLSMKCYLQGTNTLVLDGTTSYMPTIQASSVYFTLQTVDVRNLLTNTNGTKTISCSLLNPDNNMSNNNRDFTFIVGGNNPGYTCSLPWGGTINLGQSVIAYKYNGLTCDLIGQGVSTNPSETRTCIGSNNLNGSYQYQNQGITPTNCNTNTTTCNLPWGGTISVGQSVLAYKYSTLTCDLLGQGVTTNPSETRTCISSNNLNGTFQNRYPGTTPTNCGSTQCTQQSYLPLNTTYYENLGLTVPSDNHITKYKIEWFDGSVSVSNTQDDWFVPGINDVDPSNTSRRMRSYFRNHAYTTETCPDVWLGNYATGAINPNTYGAWNDLGYVNYSPYDSCNSDSINPFTCNLAMAGHQCSDYKRGSCNGATCQYYSRTVTCVGYYM